MRGARKEARKDERLEKAMTALEKAAYGHFETDEKVLIRVVDGAETRTMEQTKKWYPPNVAALHLLLKNIDESWKNDDQTTIDLKREKIALERMKAEMNEW